MTFKYNEIVPWGRNFDEYKRMFNLTEDELKLKILGCGDGPASFNVECNQAGGNVISIDPVYNMTKEQIQQRIDETCMDVLSQTASNREKFVWNAIRSVEDLGRIRMGAMKIFLESYDRGKATKKYIPGGFPDLPFENHTFDLALSSHFLFLYTDNLTYDFHVQAMSEMLRVAKEARIFPLLDFNAKRSSYVEGILRDFKDRDIEIRKVDYEFQVGGNEVLIIRNKTL
ncbi:MAG: class I SAM-dependent methyltransferase [Desulfobacteraceae bacterium]|nr:class I SAM-dependent methyltransferase [Desulfobacteraceae bacterium]